MILLMKLRTLQLERLDVHEMIELVTVGRFMLTTYEGYGIPVPEWLTESLTQLDAEIKRSRRDALTQRQKELVARLSNLRTREEQRADLEAELAKVRGDLSTA